MRHIDAQAFVTGLSVRLAPNTARQVHAIVRTIFASAVHDRLVYESPFSKIRLPRVQRARIEPLTVDQVRDIAAAAPPRLRALVLVAAGTGLRSGELLGLTVDRVDSYVGRSASTGSSCTSPALHRSWGRRRRLRASGSSRRRRSSSSPSRAHRELPPSSGRSDLPGREGWTATATLHGRWVHTLRRAGMDTGLHFHHLRHHYASVLIDGGESVKVVQERLGHASPDETLRTYTHLWPTSDQRTRSVVESAWAAETDRGRTRVAR